MTTRAGNVIVGTIDKFKNGTETKPSECYGGSVFVNAVTIGSAPPVYKNKGWYATGSVFETWITTPLPGTNFNPATSHFLTDVDHVILS